MLWNLANTRFSSEVIREALRDWKQKRLLQVQNIDELRRLWLDGINSGAGQYADIDAIKQEASRRSGQIAHSEG